MVSDDVKKKVILSILAVHAKTGATLTQINSKFFYRMIVFFCLKNFCFPKKFNKMDIAISSPRCTFFVFFFLPTE